MLSMLDEQVTSGLAFHKLIWLVVEPPRHEKDVQVNQPTIFIHTIGKIKKNVDQNTNQ